MYQHTTSLNMKCFHSWNFLKQKIGVTDLCVLVRSVVIMAVTMRFTIFWDAKHTHGFEELTAPHFREEDCGNRFIQNVCTYLPDHKLSYIRRHILSLYIWQSSSRHRTYHAVLCSTSLPVKELQSVSVVVQQPLYFLRCISRWNTSKVIPRLMSDPANEFFS